MEDRQGFLLQLAGVLTPRSYLVVTEDPHTGTPYYRFNGSVEDATPFTFEAAQAAATASRIAVIVGDPLRREAVIDTFVMPDQWRIEPVNQERQA